MKKLTGLVFEIAHDQHTEWSALLKMSELKKKLETA